MIKLFKTTENLGDLLNTNGDVILRPSKAVVHQAENSDFYLELELPIDYLSDLVYGYQIVAQYLGGYEIFRVGAVTATRDKLKVKCPHITYDTDFMFWYDDPDIGSTPPRMIGDRTIVGCNDLNKVLNFIYTPITTMGTKTVAFGRKRRIDLDLTAYPIPATDIVVTNGCSITEMTNTLLKQYGGYIYRHHYDYKIIPDRVLNDSQELICYGKNLKSITRTEIADNYATGILVMGASKELIDSSNGLRAYGYADAFMARRINIDQSNVIAEAYNNEYAYRGALSNDLDAKAANFLAENATLKLNYDIKALVDDITGLWDVVMIKDTKLGVNIDATVISFQYDLLLETFNEVTFGNYSKSMKNYNAKITDKIDTVWNKIPSQAYPVGSVITWTNNYVTPNSPNSGLDGYWSSLGSNQWERKA